MRIHDLISKWATLDIDQRQLALAQFEMPNFLDQAVLDSYLSAVANIQQSDEQLSKVVEVTLKGLAANGPKIRLLPELLNSELYEKIPKVAHKLQNHSPALGSLLEFLAGIQTQEAIELFSDLLTQNPPSEEKDIMAAISPLIRYHNYQVEWLFPKLFEGLDNSVLAPSIFDLANFVTREEICQTHPAMDRVETSNGLLGAIVQNLAIIEERAIPDEPGEVGRKIIDGVSLIISLCDCLALCNSHESVGKLRQAMSLKHRRVQVEAAAALTRLGDEEGKTKLIELAEAPVVRARVLKYAEELELLDSIDQEYQSEAALAESQLAVWLSKPMQMGVAPDHCKTIITRNLSWPGFESPVNCYLIEYKYTVGENELRNIGIAGPIVHAFACDLSDLSPDDIFAAFAGWQAEHDDIKEFPAHEVTSHQRGELIRLERKMSDRGLLEIVPQLFAYFFGTKVLVASANSDEGKPILAVADDQDVIWFSKMGKNPIGTREAFCIYKGRMLLRTFN